MKKYIYIIILACFALLVSCADLDQDPQSFQTIENYYKNSGAIAAELSAEGLPITIWDGNYGFNCRMQRFSLGADDITTLKSSDMVYFRDLNPQTSGNNPDVAPVWKALTKMIFDANILLKYAQVKDGLTDPAQVEKEEKRVAVAKGEAYFMRALGYFYMIRLFGQCTLILDNDRDAVSNMPLSTPEEIYTKAIIPSLEEAIKNLGNKSRSGNSSLPSKWAAKTLLADVYITMAGWPLKKGTEYYAKAAKEAQEIMTAATEAELSLTEKYEDLFKEAKKKDANEHLFALHHSVILKNASQYGKSYYPADFSPNAGWADYFANIDFFLGYPDDERKAWNYMTEWLSKQTDASGNVTTQIRQYDDTPNKTPLISKYFDYDDGEHGKNALSNGLTPIYRYADVLLIYAEASAAATGAVSAEAIAALNSIQTRAGGTLTSSTDITTFKKAVFDEYGWEFMDEFRRWFQLVRLEKVSEVKASVWDASHFKRNNHYYMPIPNEQTTLTGWSNNPGY